MHNCTPLRPYTVEMRRTDGPGDIPHAAEAGDGAQSEARHRELMQELAEIRSVLSSLMSNVTPDVEADTPAEGPVAAAPLPEVVTEDGEGRPEDLPVTGVYDHADIKRLLLELGELSFAISETKREIAALRQRNAPPEALGRATDELDAVVQATEGATETILTAAERVDSLVGVLRASAADGAQSSTIDEIGEQVIAIFEACNFQDITGQRITKVVTTMKFVEDRIDRMMCVLGGPSAFENIEVVEQEVDEDAKLLQGPALADECKISQDDIDAFFS